MNMKEIDDIFCRIEETEGLQLINTKQIGTNIAKNIIQGEISKTNINNVISKELDEIVNDIMNDVLNETIKAFKKMR